MEPATGDTPFIIDLHTNLGEGSGRSTHDAIVETPPDPNNNVNDGGSAPVSVLHTDLPITNYNASTSTNTTNTRSRARRRRLPKLTLIDQTALPIKKRKIIKNKQTIPGPSNVYPSPPQTPPITLLEDTITGPSIVCTSTPQRPHITQPEDTTPAPSNVSPSQPQRPAITSLEDTTPASSNVPPSQPQRPSITSQVCPITSRVCQIMTKYTADGGVYIRGCNPIIKFDCKMHIASPPPSDTTVVVWVTQASFARFIRTSLLPAFVRLKESTNESHTNSFLPNYCNIIVKFKIERKKDIVITGDWIFNFFTYFSNIIIESVENAAKYITM